MAEGSSARSILGGLGGPKARPNGVADGQTVDIPSPRPDDQVWCGDGASRAERGAGDAASKRAGPAPSGAVPRRKRAQGPPWASRSALAPEKSPGRGCWARPYRKPTLVAGYQRTKGNG